MGRYLGKKCKGVVGEIAVVGVRTRARAALAMAASASSPAKKIQKVSKSSLNNNIPQLRSRRRNLSAPEKSVDTSSKFIEEEEEVENYCPSSDVISTRTTIRSDLPPSCCSSNNNDDDRTEMDVIKDDGLGKSVADPEVSSSGGEASTKQIECERAESREATPSEGRASPGTPATKSTVEIKMPSDSEIEEFFVAAEKDIQKRFCDKYNFDIAKDVPLTGRYDWVPIKP